MRKISTSIFILLLSLFMTTPSYAQETTAKLHVNLGENISIIREADDQKILIKDYMNSTRQVVSSSGFEDVSYYPFGDRTDTDVQDISNQQYTGHRKLDNLEVYHANARFYSPRLGRFVQADKPPAMNQQADVPNVPGVGSFPTQIFDAFHSDPHSLNLYKYAVNSPMMYSDPSGRDAVLLFASDTVFGAAHTAMLVQDENGDWFYFSWGPRGKSPLSSKTKADFRRVPELYSHFDANGSATTVDPLSSADSLNYWLNNTPDDYGGVLYEHQYDLALQISGDFSASVEAAKEVARVSQEGGNRLNPNNWYSVTGNNCMQQCLSLLGESFEEQGSGFLESLGRKVRLNVANNMVIPILSHNKVLKGYFEDELTILDEGFKQEVFDITRDKRGGKAL